MSTMFNFNPADYAAQFAREGYVHISGGLTPEYFKLLAQQVDRYLEANKLKDWAIGNKQQSLYEFPTESDYYDQFMRTVGAVVGLDPRALTLSERHIKAYESNADPNPQAHKDRYASQISVGFSVSVPKGSRLVLYPKDELWVNPYNTAARLRAALTEENAPEKALKNATKIVIEDAPGDVMIFRGNAIWHLRENPANTTNLYLKLNAFNCDPLGEDPHTESVREKTLKAVTASDDELKRLIPLIGRRVDYVNRQYSRDWQEAVDIVFWGDKTMRVRHDDVSTLRRLDWSKNVATVLGEHNHQSEKQGLALIRNLASAGIIDLFEPLGNG